MEKGSYVSLETSTDLGGAFELTTLQMWHQKLKNKVED